MMTSITASFRAPGTFGCEFCPKALLTKGSLNRHRNTHIRPYKCVTCQSGFALRTDLRRHEGKHGSVDPQYMCKWPECNFKGSARKDNLLRHMKKMHSKVVTTGEEDTCNATILQDAYDEAVENQKESEKSLTILKLVQGGNFTSLKLLLRGGGNVMETTDSGKTALHVAAFNGHLDILKLLLDTNIEHNAKDTAGRSALHDAARGGNFHIFQELIAAGLSLDDRDNNDEDPLCDACRNGHRDLVQEMLGIQTQLILSDGSPVGSTPSERPSITRSTSDEYHHWVKTVGLKKYIKLAIENGHRAIAEIILVQHSDINQRHLAYALEKAARIGDNQLVVSMLQQKDLLSLGLWLRAIRLAAIHRDTPAMDKIFEEAIQLKIGADMEKLQILLLQAISSSNDDLVRSIIRKGANVNYQSGKLMTTPLYRASSRDKSTIVTTLLEAGAHVDLLSSEGTALHRATRRGNKEVVALLVEAGANVNVSVKYRGTALQEATKRGYKEIVESLIEKGANINAPGSYYFGTALQEATKRGCKEIVELLIENGAEVNALANDRFGTSLQEATKSGYKEIVELLIEKGANINAPSSYYSGTALQEATKSGYKEIVESLIEKGANINAPGSYYFGTALQEAVKRGDQMIVDMLLLAGAYVQVPANESCGTPLQEAVRNGNEYMVKQLIDLDVDVNASAVGSKRKHWERNRNPEIAIWEAFKGGNQAIVYMLIRAGAVDLKEG